VNFRAISFLLIIFSSILSVQARPIEPVIEQYAPFAEKAFADWNIPGAAVAIVYQDKIVYMRGFGVSSLKTQEPVNTRTVFRIGSLSKGFASDLTGIMVERGHLDWDDKVVEYLPRVSLKSKKSTQNLTVRHLLSHQSGLPSHSYDNLIEAHKPYSEIILSLNKLPLNCPVGKCYNYQNATYSVVGNVLEVATGQHYNELLRRHIFQPLQMYDASVTYDDIMSNPNHAECHIGGGGKFAPCPIGKAYYAVAPAGGVNASINDMAQWLRAQLGGYPQVISPKVLREVQTPHVETRSELRQGHSPWRKERLRAAHYGMGWRVYDYAGSQMIFHGGALRGVSAAIAFMPQEQVGIVILTNSNVPIPGMMVAKFYDLYLGLPERDWGNPHKASGGGKGKKARTGKKSSKKKNNKK
jgi:beta-lactamase class C